jgi:superfamily II DNA or RNA helicase
MSDRIELRDYQQAALNSITDCHEENDDKCLVKMFCGTGKTIVMLRYTLDGDFNFSVFVFPSIALITQFNQQYLKNKTWNITTPCMSVCSKNEIEDTTVDTTMVDTTIVDTAMVDTTIVDTATVEKSLFTTDEKSISRFLSRKPRKIVCVTYHSYSTLVDCMIKKDIFPDITNFDEAHHALEDRVSSHIFHDDFRGKQVFYTATPHNTQDLSMDDGEDCGPIAFDYTHREGVRDGYLNDFEIRVDFSTENDNYRKIARSILTTGNNRVLTFHSRVNNTDTSVREFVDEKQFRDVFDDTCRSEFPHLVGKYTSIRMFGIDSNTKNRPAILNHLDGANDENEVVIVSSCKTIGEGVDTKNANMCVFIDPKASLREIIQNIGRIVRLQSKISTVLIPVCVDRTRHNETDTAEERDAIIREDMSKSGNYNTILNVMSALRQEDPELFDMCLRYPKNFTDDEMKANFDKQGISFLKKTLTETEFEDKVRHNPTIKFEVHTPDCEHPVQVRNVVVEMTEMTEMTENTEKYWKDNDRVYHKMDAKSTRKNDITPPSSSSPSSNKKLKFHTSDDLKVLWSISDDDLFTRKLCGTIESKVEKYDSMKRAMEIVDWVKSHGGRMPSQTSKDKVEKRHGIKLSCWRRALKGNGKGKCYPDVRAYLDENLPGWSDDFEAQAKQHAEEIVEWVKSHGGKMPSSQSSKDKVEKRHGIKLSRWRQALKGKGKGIACYPKVNAYLDENLPGWSDDLEAQAKQHAEEIVEWVKSHGGRMPSQHSKDKVEKRHGQKLANWRKDLKGTGKVTTKCYDEVRDYLDRELPGWSDNQDLEAQAKQHAEEIVEWVKSHGGKMPSSKCSKDKVEKRHGIKLSCWKQDLKKGKGIACYPKVNAYLDENLPGWSDERDLEAQAKQHAEDIVEWVKSHGGKMPSETSKDQVEKRHSQKLSQWRQALKGNGKRKKKCYDEVRDYLDAELPGWRKTDNDTTPQEETDNGVKKAETRDQDELPPESSRQAEERALKAVTKSPPSLSKETTRTKSKKCVHKWTYGESDGDFVVKRCDLCGRQQTVNRCSRSPGYKEPNPEKKRDINDWFQSGYNDYLPGKAVVLDATGMKSTHALVASGKFSVEDIVVPEYCDETYEENCAAFPEFASCLRSGKYLDVLRDEVALERVSVMYADFTGNFDKYGEPLLEYLKTVNGSIRTGTVMGITWSENGKKDQGTRHKISKYLGAFEAMYGWIEMTISPQELGYGVGGNMCVVFYVKT